MNQVHSSDQTRANIERILDKMRNLSVTDCRQVAYEMAKTNGIKMPKIWVGNRLAGLDWLRGFRQRHQDLTLRKPKACSLKQASR